MKFPQKGHHVCEPERKFIILSVAELRVYIAARNMAGYS